MGSPRKFKFKKDPEKKIAQIAGTAITKCRKIAKNGPIIKIFVFPTFDRFVKRKMYGISGFCAWKNSMLLFIHPHAKNLTEHFREAVAGGPRSPWASSLTGKQTRKLFGRLKNKPNLQTSRLNWLEVFKTPPKEILEKSGFA